MGMPSRLHGKMVPLAPGKGEVCPYCLRQYKYVTIQMKNGKPIKLCPFCGNVLSGSQGFQSKLKSAVEKIRKEAKQKKK